MEAQKRPEGCFIFPDVIESRKCDNEFGLITRKGAPVYALSLSEVERLCAENTKSFKEKNPAQEAFEKSLKYASKFKKINSYETSELCRNMLQQRGLSARETGMMLNLMPYNAEEAKSLIPTLERFEDDLVEESIKSLVQYKETDNVV